MENGIRRHYFSVQLCTFSDSQKHNSFTLSHSGILPNIPSAQAMRLVRIEQANYKQNLKDSLTFVIQGSTGDKERIRYGDHNLTCSNCAIK